MTKRARPSSLRYFVHGSTLATITGNPLGRDLEQQAGKDPGEGLGSAQLEAASIRPAQFEIGRATATQNDPGIGLDLRGDLVRTAKQVGEGVLHDAPAGHGSDF